MFEDADPDFVRKLTYQRFWGREFVQSYPVLVGLRVRLIRIVAHPAWLSSWGLNENDLNLTQFGSLQDN